MVLLNVKKGDKQLFLYETTVEAQVEDVLKDIIYIGSLQDKIVALDASVSELLDYGIIKNPKDCGYIEERNEECEDIEIDGIRFTKRADPTGRRSGLAPSEEHSKVVKEELEKAKKVAFVDTKVFDNPINKKSVEEAIMLVKSSLVILYPSGFPEYEPVQEVLTSNNDINPNDFCLWLASKNLDNSKFLKDYLGRNEKTKAVIKIQKVGQGAPVREPMISEQTQKDLMAYYYKKQQEEKELLKDNDASYMDSAWANPKSLKNYFNGIGNVSWKPC